MLGPVLDLLKLLENPGGLWHFFEAKKAIFCKLLILLTLACFEVVNNSYRSHGVMRVAGRILK